MARTACDAPPFYSLSLSGDEKMNAIAPENHSRWRAAYIALALAMFALWGWSLQEPIRLRNYAYSDGMEYIGLFWTTLTCAPLGIALAVSVWRRHENEGGGARLAFYAACVIVAIVVGFLILQRIANGPEG